MGCPTWVDTAAPRTHRLLIENLSASNELQFYELFIMETLEVSKIIQAIAILARCSEALHSKALLLKSSHTWVIGHREIKEELN